MTPSAKWETITPGIARSMLATSPGNRSLREGSIARWANDIRQGRFAGLNGETIKVNDLGQLRDGHHRLNAIILAGMPVQMLVVRDIPDAMTRTIDAGHSRKPGDRLQMDGEVRVNILAAALSWQYRYEGAVNVKEFPSRRAGRLVGDDIFAALEAHPKMRDAAKNQCHYPMVRRLLSPGQLAFCLYHTGKSVEFWARLNDGIGLMPGSPILALRNRLLENKESRTKLGEEDKLAITIKAHNLWFAKRTVTMLRWRTQGDSPEMFPRWTEAARA
jgi:hypothetical protein